MTTTAQAPIKVLHIFGSMVRDGAELRLVQMIRTLNRGEYLFHFCTLSGEPGDLDAEILELGGAIFPTPLGPAFPLHFRRLLRQERYDVVHSHVHHFSGVLNWIAAREKVPVRITHFHTTDDGYPATLRRRIQRPITRYLTDRYSTSLISVSEGAMEAWDANWRADCRSKVVYNGLDLAPFCDQTDPCATRREFGVPDDCALFLHVGRMDPQKNHRRLLSIFAAIAAEQPDAHLLLVGRGGNDIERSLRAEVERCGLADRVLFAGRRTDVPRLMQAADLLLLPSLWEGLPGVVLEACAAGLPVLGSDVPGNMEIARYFPGVHMLPLAQDDEEWSRRARALVAEQPVRARERHDPVTTFAATPFTMRGFACGHHAVWRPTEPAWRA